MIQIEKNIPIPENPRANGAPTLPFQEMTPGDSFAISVPENTAPAPFAAKLRNRANGFGNKHGWKFTVLLVDGSAKVRVWRTV